MAKVRLVEVHPETPEEKALREWFEKKALASPDTLEAAARTILGLVTGLVGILFGVLTVSAETLPVYMHYPSVRWMGIVSIVALLAALVGSLAVILPRPIRISSERPDEEAAAFNKLLARKSRWLTWAVIFFGVGIALLGAVLIVAISLAA